MTKKNEQKWADGNTGTSAQKRTRHWCFTVFQDKEKKPEFDEAKMKYLIVGDEICPDTGRPHWQSYVYFYNETSFKSLKKLVGNSAHLEVCKGSSTQNIAYCSKEGSFEEYGVKPSQGARVDLDKIRDEIFTGKSVDEICSADPIMFHQYGRTMERLETIAARKKWRNFMTEGIWVWGRTGTGKSHETFDNYHPDTHYILMDDNGWWDGYKQQETVIINDYRGHLKYEYLLQLVDKYPFKVNMRNKEPIPFMSKKVIITSSLPPEEVYCRRNEKDDLDQLLRRFEVIEKTKVWKE